MPPLRLILVTPLVHPERLHARIYMYGKNCLSHLALIHVHYDTQIDLDKVHVHVHVAWYKFMNVFILIDLIEVDSLL